MLQELDDDDGVAHRKNLPLQGYVALLDTLHVEADRRDRTVSTVSHWAEAKLTAAGCGAVDESMNRKTGGRLGWHEAAQNVLDGELPALIKSVRTMPSIEIPRRCTGIVPKRQTLTARTRNSEVLPAFCKPIMVMSISVALQIEKGGRQFHLAVGTIFAFSWYKFARDEATHGAQGEWKIRGISRRLGRGNGPEQA